MSTHSINVRTGDGVTKQFSVDFSLGFLSRSDVKVYVDGEVDGGNEPVARSFTWINDGLIELSGDAPGNGVRVEIIRTTSKTALFNDYQDGDPLIEQNLDDSFKQVVHLVHEVLDGRFGTFVNDIEFESSGHRVRNMLAPVLGGDAVNLSYLNERIAALVSSLAGGGGGEVTDPLLLSNGIVGAPTYSFENSTNSGVYYDPASQSVKIGSNGKEAAAFRSDGDVSLGQNLQGYEALRVNSVDGQPVRLDVFPSTSASATPRIKAVDGEGLLTDVNIELQPGGEGNVRIDGQFKIKLWEEAITSYSAGDAGVMVHLGSATGAGPWYQGAGLYSVRYEDSAVVMRPMDHKAGHGPAELGKTALTHTVDATWAGKFIEFTPTDALTVTINADLIEYTVDDADAVPSFEFTVRLGNSEDVSFTAGSGVNIYPQYATAAVSPAVVNREGTVLRVRYVATGSGTANVYIF